MREAACFVPSREVRFLLLCDAGHDKHREENTT